MGSDPIGRITHISSRSPRTAMSSSPSRINRRTRAGCGWPTTTCSRGCPVSSGSTSSRRRTCSPPDFISASTTCCPASRRSGSERPRRRRCCPPPSPRPARTHTAGSSAAIAKRSSWRSRARSNGGRPLRFHPSAQRTRTGGPGSSAPPSSFSVRCRTSISRARCSRTRRSRTRRSTRCRWPPSRLRRRWIWSSRSPSRKAPAPAGRAPRLAALDVRG